MTRIYIKYVDTNLPKLSMLPNGDWIDLYTREDVTLKKGDFYLIPLNVIMKLPSGYEAHVVPRSSTFMRYGILQANSFGVIDESYCGDNDEWKFPAYATKDISIQKGTRIAQFRIMEKMSRDIEFYYVSDLKMGNSRGGFGSTGV